MSQPKRKRGVQLNFRVSEEELAAIESKMEQLGIFNREAYLRKMALDGYAVRLDLPELKELLTLLRRHSSNLNQLVRRVNTTGRVYEADLEDIIKRQSEPAVCAILIISPWGGYDKEAFLWIRRTHIPTPKQRKLSTGFPVPLDIWRV